MTLSPALITREQAAEFVTRLAVHASGDSYELRAGPEIVASGMDRHTAEAFAGMAAEVERLRQDVERLTNSRCPARHMGVRCSEPDRHDGSHRSDGGTTWE